MSKICDGLEGGMRLESPAVSTGSGDPSRQYSGNQFSDNGRSGGRGSSGGPRSGGSKSKSRRRRGRARSRVKNNNNNSNDSHRNNSNHNSNSNDSRRKPSESTYSTPPLCRDSPSFTPTMVTSSVVPVMLSASGGMAMHHGRVPLHPHTQMSPALTNATPESTGSSTPARKPKMHMQPPLSSGWSRTLRVCQYNILGDGYYACVGPYAKNNWAKFNDYSTPEEREWTSRFPKLMSHMDGVGADLYCLEEVQYHTFIGNLLPAFNSRGFYGFLSRREKDSRSTDPRNLFVAVFFRTSALSLKDQPITVRFWEEALLIADTEDGWDLLFRTATRGAAKTETGKPPTLGIGHVLDKAKAKKQFQTWVHRMRDVADNEALICLLKHKATGSLFVACVGHLFHAPSWADIKAFQAFLLCNAVKRALIKWKLPHTKHAPVVMCADMNSLPRGSVVHGGPEGAHVLVTTGTLSRTHVDHPSTDTPSIQLGEITSSPRTSPVPGMRDLTTQNLSLRSAYAVVHGDEPAFTTKTGTFRGCLDYIFVGGGIGVNDVMQLPYAGDGADFGPMPNQAYPSDHLLLAASLSFLPSPLAASSPPPGFAAPRLHAPSKRTTRSKASELETKASDGNE